MRCASFRVIAHRSTIALFAARDAIRSAHYLLEGMRFSSNQI
jgi:hypothetical protein